MRGEGVCLVYNIPQSFRNLSSIPVTFILTDSIKSEIFEFSATWFVCSFWSENDVDEHDDDEDSDDDDDDDSEQLPIK